MRSDGHKNSLVQCALGLAVRRFGMDVRLIVLGAATAVAAVSAMASPSFAADLYNEDPPQRSGSAYDDPRYADLYGDTPAPRHRIETHRPYADALPLPRERVYRDEERYADRDIPRRTARGCPSKDEISRMLERDGWRGFSNPRVVDGSNATIDAVRPNGRAYRLEVDRCTGEIFAARPLDGQRYGSDRYGAYADDDRRAPRSY